MTAEPPASVGVEHCLDVIARVVRCFREESTCLSWRARTARLESRAVGGVGGPSVATGRDGKGGTGFGFPVGAFAEKGNGGGVTFISVEVLRFPGCRAASSKLVGDTGINGSLADSRRLPLWISSMQDRSQNISLSDYGKSEGGKSVSDDEDGGRRKCASGTGSLPATPCRKTSYSPRIC
nr:hypothetical protein Iba_scaffold4341CG0250 [Ipomoea batatas]GME11681.1 hypothetical protein Iba_scaffold12129CG0020 [Ipomoea batatas]